MNACFLSLSRKRILYRSSDVNQGLSFGRIRTLLKEIHSLQKLINMFFTYIICMHSVIIFYRNIRCFMIIVLSKVKVPESKTVHTSLTSTGSINVVEFSAIPVGSLITLVKFKSERQSLSCILVKLIKSIFYVACEYNK